MSKSEIVNSIEQVVIIFTKATFERLLRTENFEELWALYSFYAYTSKWQETRQPKATVSYVAKGMKWDRKKVMKYRLKLKELGLIEDVIRKDNVGKILGHYVKINYVLNEDSTKDILVELRKKFHSPDDGDSGKTSKNFHSPKKPQCGSSHSVGISSPNAYNNKEMLSTNSLNAEPFNKKFMKKKQKRSQSLGDVFSNVAKAGKP